jgi:hypothetical protein
MMNKNPYIYNPVAKMMLESLSDKLFENEKVDSLLGKACDNALNCFKILTFDLAPKRDRNPDVLRVKVSDVANSKDTKELTAKLLDYADDNEVSDPLFAEVKSLYLSSLKKFTDALVRAAEISKENNQFIIKKFKSDSTKLQGSVDIIAKQAEEELAKKEEEEAKLSESLDFINEGIFSGYKGRVSDLKKLLANLISSAEGKDQKNGYGRDWKRTFIELDQQRKTLDTHKGEIGEKNKKNLEDLEKKVEKFQDEFNNSLISSSNRALQNLENDEEVYTSYTDVTELINQALDYLTRAKTQYSIALKEISNRKIVKEEDISKLLFPIKKGDKDSNPRFKGSRIIFNIQSAFCNSLPAAKRAITANGGPSGNFGSATKSVVATLQKIAGNKNTNGEIDKALLSNILDSDWVSRSDKDAIQKSIEKIKEKSKVNESVDAVKSLRLNEEKIVINQSEFEKELKNQYKEITGKTNFTRLAKGGESGGGKSSDVSALAKKLRSEYSIKVESDDFVKADGGLKSSYSSEFIASWNKAIDMAKPTKDFSYFFTRDGIYNINLPSSSLKTPCNWTKWASIRQIKTMGNEDATSFVENYLKGWTTFGMIRPQWRYEGIRELLRKNAEEGDDDLVGAYEMMESSIKSGPVPFVDYDNLKDEIADAFRIVLQTKDKSPDLEGSDFIALNNFLIMIANCVSFDGSKFISCIKWIHDNVLGESVANRISKDTIGSFGDFGNSKDPFLGYQSSKIIVSKVKELEDVRNKPASREASRSLSGFQPLISMGEKEGKGIKGSLGKNLFYISADIYPSVAAHVKRMNATSFEDVPQSAPFKCVNADSK